MPYHASAKTYRHTRRRHDQIFARRTAAVEKAPLVQRHAEEHHSAASPKEEEQEVHGLPHEHEGGATGDHIDVTAEHTCELLIRLLRCGHEEFEFGRTLGV